MDLMFFVLVVLLSWLANHQRDACTALFSAETATLV